MNRVLAALLLAPGLALAAPLTYTIDAGHTHPGFAISHFGFSTFRGRFDKTAGTLTLDLDKKSGSADVSIDVASISTGVAKLDEHLKSPEFFDVAKYPAITFKARELKFDGDKLASASGDLTIHGVTKPVTLQAKNFKCGAHPMKKVPACGADLTGTIKRSEFGVSTYSPNVGEDVALEIQVEAQAAAP
jgi:polyisoprenoid-binding protein YceI